MTIKEALEEICSRQIPKEINGVRTKYVIHERKIFDYPEVLVTILPEHLREKNIGTTHSYGANFHMNYDYKKDTLGYRQLERDIEEILCLYIRRIILYFQGEVIETRVMNFNIADVFKEEK